MWARRSKPFILTAVSALTYGVAINNSPEDPETKTRWSSFEEKKYKARSIIKRHMVVNGIPGMSVGVSVDGSRVWSEGFGYANVETGSTCTSDTIMRIASISKPITSTIAAKLVQEGKLDLDKPIQDYVTDFPTKKFNEKEVQITTRQLLAHTGGIRHYHCEKKDCNVKLEDIINNNTTKEEFLSNVNYSSVNDALEMFKNDDLVAEPGKEFRYTTHGLTLVSAVLEKASGKQFSQLVQDLCFQLGMRNTSLDVNKNIILNRTSYYHRNKNHVLENCQEVNNSYKWAGGGLLSSVGDLLIFANAILFSYQTSSSALLSQDITSEFWKGEIPINETTISALGWMRVRGNSVGGMEKTSSLGEFWYHTGAAVGASSVLLIRPRSHIENTSVPSGVCVAMVCNLQDTSLFTLARAIEEIFRN